MNEDSKTLHVTLDELLFVSIPSKARTEVIEASVVVERVISNMLAHFLDIDTENSKSFDKNGLSFSSKLMLLADIKLITSDDRAKLIKFSEIRNIFAHDSQIYMYYQCFEKNDIKNFLIKRYGEQASKYEFKEESYRVLFGKLFDDIKKICKGLFYKMIEKAENQGKTTGTIDFFKSLQNVLANMSKEDQAFGEKVDTAYQMAKETFKSNT